MSETETNGPRQVPISFVDAHNLCQDVISMLVEAERDGEIPNPAVAPVGLALAIARISQVAYGTVGMHDPEAEVKFVQAVMDLANQWWAPLDHPARPVKES